MGPLSVHRAVLKEVIQPQVPLRLPCYDFTPVMNHTVANVPPKVRLSASGAAHSHGVTGGVWHLDVGSSHPGAVAGPKGMAVRHLKRYVSWV